MQLALLALVLAAAGLCLGVVRARLRRPRASPSGGQQHQARSDQASLTRDIEAVMAELDQLSRHVHRRLDAKIAKLESLMGEADNRIDALSRLSRSAGGQPTLDVTLGMEEAETNQQAASDYKDVYALADGGVSSIEIARQLGQSAGEVELILALRKTKARAQPVRAG
jgi:hypothetical protein